MFEFHYFNVNIFMHILEILFIHLLVIFISFISIAFLPIFLQSGLSFSC